MTHSSLPMHWTGLVMPVVPSTDILVRCHFLPGCSTDHPIIALTGIPAQKLVKTTATLSIAVTPAKLREVEGLMVETSTPNHDFFQLLEVLGVPDHAQDSLADRATALVTNPKLSRVPGPRPRVGLVFDESDPVAIAMAAGFALSCTRSQVDVYWVENTDDTDVFTTFQLKKVYEFGGGTEPSPWYDIWCAAGTKYDERCWYSFPCGVTAAQKRLRDQRFGYRMVTQPDAYGEVESRWGNRGKQLISSDPNDPLVTGNPFLYSYYPMLFS